MKTKNTTRTSLNRQPDFMKLNLMDNELSSMLSKLHSYRCEPCTSEMYDEYLELNHDGRALKKTIDKAKARAQDPVKISKGIEEEINKVVSMYYKFQKSLSSYLTEAVAHH